MKRLPLPVATAGAALPGGRAATGLVLLVFAALLVACGGRAPAPTLVDVEVGLDTTQIEAAAAPLVARGVAVAVIAVAAGDNSGADFSRRLDTAGLLQGGEIAPPAVAIYISMTPRYSELRAGSGWSERLPDATLRAIRLEQLNPSLREDDPSGGVVVALAAVEAQLDASPFPPWLGAALGGAAITGLAALLAVNNDLRRNLAQTLGSSPPGRALGRLWAGTPAGRAQARRRHLALLEQASRHLRAESEAAQQAVRSAAAPAPELQARLATLDQEALALTGRQDEDPQLPAALAALAKRYRALHDELLAEEGRLKAARSTLAARAAQAATRLEHVRVSFQRKAARATRVRKPGRPPSAAGQLRLDALQDSLGQHNGRQAALLQATALAEGQIVELERLSAAYEALFADATALWKTECPADYAAASRPARGARSTAAAGATSDYSSTSSVYSSSSSSSDSSWSSSSDSSSSSSPSSDGGSW